MKLYELANTIKKPFWEIKRIVEQFIETEYYFRFRKEKDSYQRNLWVLNDTWSGGMSMFNFMDIKCRQMYNSIRKYDYHYDRHLDGYKLAESDISYDEKLPFIEKVIKDFLESSNKKYYIGRSSDILFYLMKDDDKLKIGKFTEVPLVGKTKSVIDNWETLETKEVQDYDEKLLDCSESFYSNIDADVIIKKLWAFCALSQDEIIKAFLQYESFEIKPEDYIKLSDDLKSLVYGKIDILHEIWTYRKLLRKYTSLSFDSGTYLDKQEEIYKMKDDEAKRKAFQKLYEEYKSDKFYKGLDAMSYLIEHEENWIS